MMRCLCMANKCSQLNFSCEAEQILFAGIDPECELDKDCKNGGMRE